MGSESYHLTNRTCESIRNPAHIWSIGPSNSPGHSFGLASWRIFEKHPFSLQDPSHCIGSCIHLTSKKESTHHCKKAILRETCSILPTITQKKHTKNLFEKGVIWFQSYFMISGGDYITITFTFECFQVILGSFRSDTLRSLKASTFWVALDS